MGEAKRRKQAGDTYIHVDGPIPGLELYRDLPRKPGQFIFVLAWTDTQGRPGRQMVARPAFPADVEKAEKHFQEVLRDRYQDECERVGFTIDHNEFINKTTTVLAERAVKLLGATKTQEDLRLDAPAGLLGFCLAAWMVWTASSRDAMIDFAKLQTLAVALRFERGEFVPAVAADHGDGPKPITVH